MLREATPDDSGNPAKPTVGQSFITNHESEAVFTNWLPATWLPRKQTPDLFIDYIVEVVEKGEPTGRIFAVQLKGVKVGEGSSSPLRYSADTKHARYWLEKCQHPVFMFLIDVTKRTGHWLFVQKFLHDHVSRAAFERQKTVTLRFDSKNNLDDREQFLSQLDEAEKYIRELHPSSPKAALAKVREDLERLEPRLGYGIVATETGQTIHLTVKEPFGINLVMEGYYARLADEAFKQVIEHGAEFRFPTKGVKFVGSPFFEKLGGKSGELILQMRPDIPGTLLIHLPTNKPQTLPINGVFRVGTKTATFKGEIPGAPLRIEGTFDLQSKPENMPTNLTMSLSLDRWRGQPVTALPYFELIKAVTSQFIAAGGLHMEWLIQGSPFADGAFPHPVNEDAPKFANALEWVSRLRLIAETFHLNLPFPGMNNITQEQFDLVNELAMIISEGQCIIPCPRFQATVALSNYQDGKFTFPAIGTFGFDKPDAVMEVFGVKFIFGYLSTYFTHTRVSEESINAKGHRVLKLVGNESSQRIIKRYTPPQ